MFHVGGLIPSLINRHRCVWGPRCCNAPDMPMAIYVCYRNYRPPDIRDVVVGCYTSLMTPRMLNSPVSGAVDEGVSSRAWTTTVTNTVPTLAPA